MSPTDACLVVNADDFGLSPGVCTGVLRAHEHGIVTSTSVLVTAPAFAAHAAALRDSGMGVGVHLCLVGEDPPLLAACEVPSLVDRAGRLPSKWPQFVARSIAGRVDPDDVERELSAQVEAARSAGLTLGHLDGHQHLHLLPRVGSIVMGIARNLQVPALRVVGSRSVRPPAVMVRPFAASMRRRARSRGLLVPDRAAGLDTAGHLDAEALARTVDALGGGAGVADLATHPGADPDPARARYRWGYLWAEELDALCAPEARRAVDQAGLRLTDYIQLTQARDCD